MKQQTLTIPNGRKAHLLSDENGFHRKEWIDQRLKELNQIFAISVGGFSTMDNHLHLLLRIDCEEAEKLVRSRSRRALVSPLSVTGRIVVVFLAELRR
ncbi:MAG: hypothetical protein ACK5OC_29630 [Pirellula sp.]